MTNPNIGMLAATTIENYSKKLADNITNHSPLLRNVFMKGNVQYATGGTKIRQELMYAENGTVKWYSGLETLDVSESEVLDAADFEWKQLNANVVISGEEEIKNDGSEAIHNLIKAKVKAAEITLQNTVNTSLYSDGTGTSGKEIGGLQLLVADSPSTGTVGSIDRSAQSWWRNQTYDFSSEAGGNASATNIQTGMNTLYRRCLRNNDKPDVILMDDTYYGFFESSLQTIQRITREDKATLGFETLAYKSANVYYDADCPSAHMYFLNTNYIHFRPKKNRNFVVDKERMSINQDATVIPLFWAGNLTLSNASLQGVGKN